MSKTIFLGILASLFLILCGVLFESFGIYSIINPLKAAIRISNNTGRNVTETFMFYYGIISTIVGCGIIIAGCQAFVLACKDEYL